MRAIARNLQKTQKKNVSAAERAAMWRGHSRAGSPFVPLHVAAGEGSSDAAKFLCENGADVNVQSYYEELTALHRVVEEGHNECLEVLVAAGADLNARCRDSCPSVFSILVRLA